MRMYDIIAKKRDGGYLEDAEIAYVVDGFTRGDIPDYQMAAFLMAVFLRGMTAAETATLTERMAQSGDMVDLTAIHGVKVDKHSTGGVGDKTTLVVAPLVAAAGAGLPGGGVKIAKMSGRGLGHTGGTVDKMEAIPGMRVELERDEFVRQVNEIGLAVVGQSGKLAPADKKIYALRDVTATVNSIPLIAASIMSKKLAAGADAILLDVKTGNGAFMKTTEDAIALAQAMVAIGEAHGRHTAALITDMGTPLGHGIGNSIEVAEAVQTLKGKGPADLTAVCLELAAGMLELCGMGNRTVCRQAAERAMNDGSGLDKLRQMVAAQGGDTGVIDEPERFAKAAHGCEVLAPREGYVYAMDTEQIGMAAMLLGAGRETKDDRIDYAAGILLEAKTGDYVHGGQVLARLATSDAEKAKRAEQVFLKAVHIAQETPVQIPLVLARVDKAGVQRF